MRRGKVFSPPPILESEVEIMWALKGTFIGISIFGIGAVVFMFLGRSFGASTVDIRIISRATVYSAWFWATFAACIVIGLAIVRSWPGKFSPAFWIVLAVIDLVPAGMLSLFLLMLFKLKEVAGPVTG